MANEYITTDDAGSYLGVNQENAAMVTDTVEAVSRLIDNYVGDHFWQTEASTARTFEPDHAGILRFGPFNPLLTLVSIKHDTAGDLTFATTLTSSQYRLFPLNPAAAPESRPYRGFETVNYSLTLHTINARPVVRQVEVTGTWGWSAVPAGVKAACRLQVARVFKRQDSPLGVAGMGDFGAVRVPSKLDPDVRQLLDPYRQGDHMAVA